MEQLEAGLTKAVERDHLRNTDRRLMTGDREINRIIQTRLETGAWVLGSEGYLATPNIIRTAMKGTNDDAI